MSGEAYDYIIVGGGGAGCVMANRLSARSANKVLLLEAGPDFQPGEEPETIRDIYPRSVGVPALKWPGMMAQARADGSLPWRLDQGRVMGGCSAIMGMLALRGLPEDYDEWSALGLTGWTWADVLPNFKRIERDLTFDNALHGRDGEVTIRRQDPSEWPPLCRTLASVFADQPSIADMNGEFRDGVGRLPISATQTERVSAASAFLTREVRARPNLTIQAGCEITGLVLKGRFVAGVCFQNQGQEVEIRAREVVLSTGSLRSPVILQKAGIGDAGKLSAIGVEPTVDRPGVGRNLQNHPALYVSAFLKPRARQAVTLRPWGMNGLRYTSDIADAPRCDMLLTFINKSSWHSVGRRIGTIGASVYKAFSRGQVSIERKDGEIVPDYSLGLLSDRRDLDRLTDGVRKAYILWQHPSVAPLREHIFASPTGNLVRRLNEPTRPNAVLAALTAAAMDALPPVRRIAAGLAGDDIADIVADDGALRDYVYRKAVPFCHHVGTCRMGDVNDPSAVTDNAGRVIGVDGLRVVDGSIIPTVPRGNTYVPITMVADRIAEQVLAGR